ncbi:MAG TPA: cytochrome c biogenesis protein CcsA [Acidimicrobiales bacterium]
MTTIAPAGTGSRATLVLGWLSLAGVAALAALGLWWSPADVVQGDSVRLMYVHVPSAILMYAGCSLCALGSLMWLRKRTDGWDTLAQASAELATLFAALTLVTGMLWGRPTWGAYWTWDARLTSTTLLFLLLVGYLALRSVPASADTRARRSAVLGLLLVPNAMIVHYSVDWWNTLHQDATVAKLDPTIDDLMLFTLFAGMVVGGVVFSWLLTHRFRVAWLQRQVDEVSLDRAIVERRAEADLAGHGSTR